MPRGSFRCDADVARVRISVLPVSSLADVNGNKRKAEESNEGSWNTRSEGGWSSRGSGRQGNKRRRKSHGK